MLNLHKNIDIEFLMIVICDLVELLVGALLDVPVHPARNNTQKKQARDPQHNGAVVGVDGGLVDVLESFLGVPIRRETTTRAIPITFTRLVRSVGVPIRQRCC